MKQKQRWGPPGWPWELELLALVFVITAIAVPYYLQMMQPVETGEMSLLAQAQVIKRQNVSSWEDLEGFFWALVIVGLYLAHLATGGASIDFMSTPFTHLFAPLVFSLITYYRLFQINKGGPATANIVTGSPMEIFIWISGVLIITYLVARIRMARLMLSFRDVEWQVTTPSLMDRTYGQLVLQVRPLIYPPRMLRACENGILVEGWFYAMPISFDTLNAIDAVQGAVFASQGYCLATSLRSLVRMQVAERTEPILISPRDRNAFVRYCQQQLALRAPPVSLRSSETGRGTRPGTTRGTDKGTRSGIMHSGTRKGTDRLRSGLTGPIPTVSSRTGLIPLPDKTGPIQIPNKIVPNTDSEPPKTG